MPYPLRCRQTIFTFIAIVVVLATVQPSFARIPRYYLTPLGNGTESLAFDIAANNDVVGYYFDSGAKYFRWSAGQLTTLTAFTGSGSNAPYTSPGAINRFGEIAGSRNGLPVRYMNGQLFPLATLPDFPYGYGASINDSGQIAGTVSSVVSDGSKGRGVLYSGGQVHDLGVLPGHAYSTAEDINSIGEVVGNSTTGVGSNYRPFIYRSGSLTDLGTLGGSYSVATAVNDSGAVVGASMTTGSDWGSLRAFIYENGTMRSLGTLPGTTISEAHGINNAGQIVGATAIAVGQPYHHAFLYENGAMYDLNSLVDPSLGWTFIDANGINDDGSIIAYGFAPFSGGVRRAALLTPVPDPGTSAWLLPLIAICRTARRRSSAKPRSLNSN